MSTENNPVEPVTDDLDLFSAELFGQSKANTEPASSEETKDEDQESDAPETEDTHSEADALDTEDDIEEAEEEDQEEVDETSTEPGPKPKKNRFQERIDEVVAKQREAERRAEAEKAARLELERRLEELQKSEPKPTPKVEETGPQPTDLNEDGTEKYPLGEFDPKYIKDLMRHTLAEESKARQELERQEAERRAKDEARAALQTEWNQKLVPAQERYPDFQEKGQQLLSAFEGIDESYGEYLTTTIMEMEYGPDVLYYLANNVDEAQKIVQSGARSATIALGRLEAKFAFADEEKKQARPRVSKAPPPPSQLKGSTAVLPEVPDDTDDLDAFAAKLFKKK